MNKRTYKLMNWAKIEEIVYSESDNPHEILGCACDRQFGAGADLSAGGEERAAAASGRG